MQPPNQFASKSLTAVILGNRLDFAYVNGLVHQMKEVANGIVVLVNDSFSARDTSNDSSATITYLHVARDQHEDGHSTIREGIREAIRVAGESNHILIFSGKDAKLPSPDKIARAARAGVDYAEQPNFMVLSRRYAEYILDSGEVPSLRSASRNGFYVKMSPLQLIRSPREAIKQNWTFIKFGLVGASGVVVNLVLLTILKIWMPNIVLANAISVEVSILSNFFLNDAFTFKQRTSQESTSAAPVHGKGSKIYRLFKYNLVSLASLAVNTVVFYVLYSHGIWYIWDSLTAIIAAFLINYLGSSKWAWGQMKAMQGGSEPINK